MDKKIINNIITKLSEEKVELSLADDIKKNIDSLDGITQKLQGDLKKYISLQKSVENKISDGDAKTKELKSDMQKIEKQVKELGLDANSVMYLKIAKNIIREYEQQRKTLTKVVK